MRLERVDILGFKSFPERTELSFHEGVTAIVGPNGCGKSNVSDAIGWVLGEQSAKSLRGQKMEDLIFSGSESRDSLGVAEVNLCLSQVNGDSPGERRHVVVTRRLYRSGESEYLMDGSPCRLRDIQDLFMDTGIGAKAYAIIEQGKIGLVLSSKPSDRRGLIEEAAGITKYRARRRSAELKLQAAQQNLYRVNDIVYEIERQINSLKRQASKARRYRRLRDSMSHLQKIVAVKTNRERGERVRLVRRELKTLTDRELQRTTGVVTAESYLERLRLEQAEREGALSDARERLHQLELTVERLDNQIVRDGQQAGELARRRGRLDTELEELGRRLGPSSRQLEARRADEQAVTAELSRLEEKALLTSGQLSQASAALATTEQEIEAARSELVHRISKIAALKNFLQGVVANGEKVSSEILKLRNEARELETERRGLEKGGQALEKELGAHRAKAGALVAQRSELDKEASRLARELQVMEPEIARRREELSGVSARRGSLQELLQTRSHYRAGARHLLTVGNQHGLRVRGSIADAVEVDPRLELAAESFWGDVLQRVIVPSEEDALTVRRFLEREGAGRCDLLIESLAAETAPATARGTYDSLWHRRVAGLVGIMSDFVRWTQEEPELLSRILADAVVVETLEQAFAARRWEPTVAYVTLAGEVIEPPGVLRVGSGGPGEGLLRTRREVRELEEIITRTKGELEDLEGRHREAQAELASRRTRLTSLQEEQHTVEKSLVGLEHRRRQLEEERERLERKGQVLAAEQGRSESERTSLGAKRVEMEQSLADEQQVKERVEKRLEELRGSLGERRAELERLTGRAAAEASQVAALRERVQAVRLDLERLREGVDELEARLAAARREKLGLGERESELHKRRALAEMELKQSLSEREQHRQRVSHLEGETSDLRQRIEMTHAALRIRRKELEAVRDSRAGEDVALARLETEKAHFRDSFRISHGISIEEAAAVLNPTELLRSDEELNAEVAELKRKLDSIGPVNPMADEEYRELETRHGFLSGQRQDLLDSISSTESAIRRIDATSRKRFREAFAEINRHFEVTFKQLFGGGRAGLRLLDEQDILESGIDIIAQPPGKKLQNVLLLSGGEKALTAIALMFAIFRYKPSPFCLLDEVDAPLDDANVGRFVSMLRELRETTQFIIITHNRRTMEIADHMYGVTMEEPGISKLVSVRLVDEAPAEASAAT